MDSTLLEFIMHISPIELHALLRQNIVEVTFTKLNGERRVMQATLMADLLPVYEGAPRTGQVLTETTSSMAVYDTEVEGWRSFRLDTIERVVVNGQVYVPTRSMLTE